LNSPIKVAIIEKEEYIHAKDFLLYLDNLVEDFKQVKDTEETVFMPEIINTIAVIKEGILEIINE